MLLGVPGVMATPRSEGTPYDVTYGHTRVFVGAGHAAILERMQASLMKQGFRVLSSIDLQQSLKSSTVSPGPSFPYPTVPFFWRHAMECLGLCPYLVQYKSIDRICYALLCFFMLCYALSLCFLTRVTSYAGL